MVVLTSLFTFLDDVYYRWNTRHNRVQSGYPQKTSNTFLECTKGSFLLQRKQASSSVKNAPLLLVLLISLVAAMQLLLWWLSGSKVEKFVVAEISVRKFTVNVRLSFGLLKKCLVSSGYRSILRQMPGRGIGHIPDWMEFNRLEEFEWHWIQPCFGLFKTSS